MKKLIVFCATFIVLGCSQGGDNPPENRNASNTNQNDTSPIAMTLIDGGSGLWTIEIDKKGANSLYAFSRSENDYRSESWQSVSGADFTRKHGFDTIELTADKAALTFTPYTAPLRGTYTPFISFSDGGSAVFAGQFDLFTFNNEAALKALGGDIYKNTGPLFAAPLTIKSNRPILYGGERNDGPLTITMDGKSSYAYVGNTAITQGQNFSGVIDPGLPDWITGRIDDDLTLVFDALAERWGFGLDQKATILLAFEGYDLDGLSATGGALPGNMIVMQLSGTALKTENPRILSHLHWFFTHESVHLFQGHTNKHYAHNRYSWINEGGANTMTSMIMAGKGLAQDGYLVRTYGNSFDLCANALEGKTLEKAIEAGPEGNYDCGDLIGRITDAALPDHNFFEFWNAFLAGLDKNFTDVDYFNTMRSLGADEAIVERLDVLTSATVNDAAATLRELMNDVGIATTFKDEKLTSIAFPQ